MPPPRKLDLIDEDLRTWLEDELKERGFSDYVQLTDDLNARLEDRGEELRIGKSAVHNFGAEHKKFIELQRQTTDWAQSWVEEEGMKDEAGRHKVLVQMISAIAFNVLKSQLTKDGDQVDPKELHFLARMLKDMMASSGIREKLTADERARVAQETRENAATEIEKTSKQLGLTKKTVEGIKAAILGVK